MTKSADKNSPSSVDEALKLDALLLTCPDQVRVKRLLDGLTKALSKASTEVEVQKWRADQISSESIQQIQSGLASLSLFGNLQVTIISKVDTIKANLQEKLLELSTNTSPNNRLILQADKLASNSRLLKHFQKAQAHIDLPELKGAQLKSWVQAELKLNGVKTSNLNLVQRLIDLGQQSPDLISIMCNQLGNYLNEGEALDEQAISALFTAHQEANQFEVAEHIASAKVANTEVSLHRLLKNGLSTFVLLAIVAKAYQNAASYRLLRDAGQRDDEIAKELNLNPWLLQKLQPIMRNYTKEQLLSHYWNFTKTDLRLKSKSIGEENIASILAQSLMPENKKSHG